MFYHFWLFHYFYFISCKHTFLTPTLQLHTHTPSNYTLQLHPPTPSNYTLQLYPTTTPSYTLQLHPPTTPSYTIQLHPSTPPNYTLLHSNMLHSTTFHLFKQLSHTSRKQGYLSRHPTSVLHLPPHNLCIPLSYSNPALPLPYPFTPALPYKTSYIRPPLYPILSLPQSTPA